MVIELQLEVQRMSDKAKVRNQQLIFVLAVDVRLMRRADAFLRVPALACSYWRYR